MRQGSINEYLRGYLSPVDGIVGIYVSDKDGARMVGVSIEDAPEQAFMTYVVTSFIASVQQLPKLGYGEVQHMITKYQNMTICQFVYAPNESTPPVYLTAVGTNACDLGALTSLEVPLRPLLGVLASRAAERFEQEAMLTRTDAGGHFYRILRTDAT
ncbi:Ragulator complex protein LAMTOR3 -like protein [Echinococcus granulosus]|nr:Ragulator complex protein LAMTOR3 -like protein [Echinococcus granulosus]